VTDMRVTEVRTTVLAVPFKDTLVNWMGRTEAKSTVLIEILTDAGIVGLGEVSGVPYPEVGQIVVHEFEKLLVGTDPRDVTAFHRRCLASQQWHGFRSIANHALGGLDMALWDIVGKVAEQPLYKLLGGAVRDRVNHYAWIPRKATADMVRDAVGFKARGFSVLYLKVGLGMDRDSTDLTALREAVGDEMALRIDVNGAWSTGEAVQHIRALEKFKLDWVEQPVKDHDMDGFEIVRKAVGVPLCIDQGVHTSALAYQAIQRRVADVICLDLYRMGGVLPLTHIAAMADLAGIPVCKRAGPEYVISAMAHVHVFATLPNVTAGCQTFATMIQEDIVNEPTNEFHDGCLLLPSAPGIGVTLNADRVKKYADMYRAMRGAGGVGTWPAAGRSAAGTTQAL